MTDTIEKARVHTFYRDVMTGLTSAPKYLQSKYFYDAAGDELFQQIMHAPEYYLSRCEEEIFSMQTEILVQVMLERHEEFDVVELGAGDATKSTHLLRCLAGTGRRFTYYPIDISKNVIQLLEREMPERIPYMQIKGLNGEYLSMLRKANTISNRRKAVLFLGSNIGNFTPQYALEFLIQLHKQMTRGDLLLIGFDLKKNPKQILAAYNDAAGTTKAFNLNLLKRINRELEADFNIAQFDHYPTYDPVTGACRSYLISLRKQSVTLAGSKEIQFEKYEPVYMELSQKYSVPEIDTMAKQTGFKPAEHFFDSNGWFLDTLWEKV